MLSLTAALVFSSLSAPCVPYADDEAGWPRWRGPLGTGEAQAAPPVRWSKDENIAWKTPLPGHGKSTPIVLGDRIFLLAAVPGGEASAEELAARDVPADLRTETPNHLVAFLVLAFDRKSGEPLWETVVAERLPVTGNHGTNGYASFSPVTDGEGLYVSFGSYGVYALDPESGEVRWTYELGPQITRKGWGEAGSPAVHGETVLVVADQEEGSYIVALDKSSGEVRWRKDRDEPSTWTTPVVVEAAGRTQVVVNGTTAARSYDIDTGEVIWYCDGQTVNAIPTPVTDGERVVVTSGYRGQACVALSLAGKGDLRESEGAIAWSHTNGTPYVPSPLLTGGRIYMTSGLSGMLTCLDLASGEVLLDRERLDLGNIYSSPIAANGHIYIVDRDGTTVVLKHSDELEIVARNVLDDPIDATPVAVGKTLYLRSETTLYAIRRP